MFGLGAPELIVLLVVFGVVFALFRFPRILAAVTAATAGGPSDTARQTGKITLVIGVLLLIFGAIRWNSAASQLLRAFGQTDALGILLFLGGAIGVVAGYCIVSSAAPRPAAATQGTGTRSVEQRIRELNDLRAKQLITEAEYEQRKKEIITSV